MPNPPAPANMTYAEVLTVHLNRSRKAKAAKRKQSEARDEGEQKEGGEDQKMLSDSATNNIDGPTTSTRKRPASPAHDSSTRKQRKVEWQEGEEQGEMLGLLSESVGILKRLEKEIPKLRQIEEYMERIARDERGPVEESSGTAESRLGGSVGVKGEETSVDSRDGMGSMGIGENGLEVN